MMRRALLLVAVASAGLAGPADGASQKPDSFTRHTSVARDTYGPRTYWLYAPPSAPAGPRPLVVYLHGCTQTGPDAAVGTRWNELARQRGFFVAYPEQRVEANGTQCWNWFLPEHQARDAGEPSIIASIIRTVAASERVDRSRIYVLGASAGADMATIMATTYPEMFAAAAGFAGCAYLNCTDVTGQMTRRTMGARAHVMPFMAVQGTVDALNNAAMGSTMVMQWVGANDATDDGEVNGSVSLVPSDVEHHGLDASTLDGLGTVGDPCARNKQFPCLGALIGAKRYPVSISHHLDAYRCSVVDAWVIHGLGHDYPHGDPRGSFTDPIGPDITTAAYEYFIRHRLGGPCGRFPPRPFNN